MYVILLGDRGDHYFATPSGSHRTGTNKLQEAQIFRTVELAQRHGLCEGDQIVNLETILNIKEPW